LFGSTRRGEKTATEFVRVEKCKGIGAVEDVDVFKARTLGWYLKPQNEEMAASGCAKGNHN